MAMAESLSSFAARGSPIEAQGERLRAAARRFAALISSRPGTDFGAGAGAAERLRARLTVQSGLHRGASIELTADEYLIGSDDDCDIVLHDAGMAPRHCRVVRDKQGFSLRDVRTATSQPVPPQALKRAGEAIEAMYEVAGVLIAVVQHAPASQAAQADRQPSPVWFYFRALCGGLALTAIGFFAAHVAVERMTPEVAERIVQGSAALAAQGFGAVRFRRGSRGDLEIAGLVADATEQERLRGWLARNGYGAARFNVQQAAGLIEQVRHTLATEDFQIAFEGGRLRIEGTTRQLPIKSRIRMLADELQGVVEIDDRVAYVDARESPKPGPLPVRIRDVMIGSPSYFRTDTGAQYYEGGVLPDGAEVVEIEASQIRFRRADQEIVYDLD